MIQWGIPNLVFPTAREWKSNVIDNILLTEPVTLVYPTGDAPTQRAQGNIRVAQLFDLFVEMFNTEFYQYDNTVNPPVLRDTFSSRMITPELSDINAVTGLPEGAIGKTLFTYAYPDALMENIDPVVGQPSQPLVDNYITYRLEEPATTLQGLTGPIFTGTHQQRPTRREVVEDDIGNKYEIQGQRHTYHLHLEIWSPSNKKADYLADWVQDIMVAYGGWLVSKGVQDIAYGWRDINAPPLIGKAATIRLPCRELTYIIILDRHYVLKKGIINQINIDRRLMPLETTVIAE
jgi:hypothetical protein